MKCPFILSPSLPPLPLEMTALLSLLRPLELTQLFRRPRELVEHRSRHFLLRFLCSGIAAKHRKSREHGLDGRRSSLR